LFRRFEVPLLGQIAFEVPPSLVSSQTTPPLVGLITDFGTGSYYLGKFRGPVYSSVPDVRLIDISH
jgi:hypothetical protein